MVGKAFLRLLPSCQVQPFGAPLRAARARANRSARIGCARQYASIASRGVGGMNGRLSELEPVPGIDVLYDIGVPILLIWYWFTFFRDALSRKPNPSQPDRGLVISR